MFGADAAKEVNIAANCSNIALTTSWLATDSLTLFEAVRRSRSYGEHRARCLLYRPADSISQKTSRRVWTTYRDPKVDGIAVGPRCYRLLWGVETRAGSA